MHCAIMRYIDIDIDILRRRGHNYAKAGLKSCINHLAITVAWLLGNLIGR